MGLTDGELAAIIIGAVVGLPAILASLMTIVLGWDDMKKKFGEWWGGARHSSTDVEMGPVIANADANAASSDSPSAAASALAPVTSPAGSAPGAPSGGAVSASASAIGAAVAAALDPGEFGAAVVAALDPAALGTAIAEAVAGTLAPVFERLVPLGTPPADEEAAWQAAASHLEGQVQRLEDLAARGAVRQRNTSGQNTGNI
ncbi:hypothetical protein PG999_010613 [Apiospora kogelbergensis]|uniref:Uncharacterized protein n=1 Tax=Apiospora kogelbergensis TaxID=1337665 RepID=A0AAW0QDF3_9PEZI